MIEVTDLLLNFQKILFPIYCRLQNVGLDKGFDEWDELTEIAYHFLVINSVKEKYNVQINHVYEVPPTQDCYHITVQVKSGSNILVGKDEPITNGCTWKNNFSIEKTIKFKFQEFYNPLTNQINSKTFEYVWGLDENGLGIFAEIESCTFYIEQHE